MMGVAAKKTQESIDELRTEMHTEIGGLRTEMHTEIGGLHTEITGIHTRIDGIDSKLQQIIDHFGIQPIEPFRDDPIEVPLMEDDAMVDHNVSVIESPREIPFVVGDPKPELELTVRDGIVDGIRKRRRTVAFPE
jgi:hypothetical protein